MLNIIDYLDWRGDVPFSAAPFNPVDNLILSQFSYISLDGIAPGTMREVVSELIKLGRVHDNNLKLSKRLAESRRFGSARVSHSMELFDPKLEMQFGALVVDTDDGATCVAFRGTDATLVGWKEDLNMSFSEEVPSQGAAVQFLNDGLRENTRPLRVMGHSKGGNLAAWAAVHLDEKLQRKRLIAAYNNDGPGFSRDLVDTPSYQAVADRLFTYIPASSIVGVLLEHAEDYEVVDSTARSIMQHEPLSWCVEGPRFVHLGQRSQLGQLSDGVLREWIGSMSPQEREQFSRAFFDILSRGGRTKTLEDLRSGGLAAGAALIREYAGADEEKKKIISEIFRRLAVDVKDELVKAAGAGVRRAGETILATGQAIADLRK